MNEELLAQLRDIHLPDSPGFWPPAPGWWLLTALVLSALIALAVILIRRHRGRRYRREAEALLARAWNEYQGGGEGTAYLQTVNQVLRRSALLAYPRQAVAGLAGPDWLGFLDKTLSDNGRGDKTSSGASASFGQGPGRVLVTEAYRAGWDGAEAEAIQQLALAWVRGHAATELPISNAPLAPTSNSVAASHARI